MPFLPEALHWKDDFIPNEGGKVSSGQMSRPLHLNDFPWEGVLVDLLLIAFWTWALPSASAWCTTFPHLAVWLVALIQAVVVGRMAALYFVAPPASTLLGWFAPLGALSAMLSVGGFIWLLGAMFSSQVHWGFFTQRMPLLLVFASIASLGIHMGTAGGTRKPYERALDAALVVIYLFAAEAFLFAMLDGAGPSHRRAMVVALVLCHLPMRIVFAAVPPTSRYELVSAGIAFVFLLREVLM